ncbi:MULTISPECIES: hypothetical protein [Leifsonia]|uniref:Uncharacterized protein n=1 Tax=Leifsonia soli TaxID=582665 RepID=A0A852SVI8_9MICO|nr:MULTISPECIES: hypothetical protein [Leifsonia]NYD72771.1 hypothetical protein [Leifsonia soli]SEA97791.1 hypothetical protein SAMN04515680_2430 [Leifsonia sp. 21MFCrub1.1]
MTSELDTRTGPSERRRTQRFAVQFGAGMLAYVLVLCASLLWGGLDGDDPIRFAWALAPVVPVVLVAGVLIRYVVRSDEYETVQTLKGLAVGFVVTMLLAVVAGFLDIAGLSIPGAGWWLYGAGMLTWLIATIVLKLR